MNHYERTGRQFREQPPKARLLDKPRMAIRRNHGRTLKRNPVDPSFKPQYPVHHVDNYNHHHHELRYSTEIPTVYSEFPQPSAENKRTGFHTHEPTSQHLNLNPNVNRRTNVDSRPIPNNPRSEPRPPVGRFEVQHHINQGFQTPEG